MVKAFAIHEILTKRFREPFLFTEAIKAPHTGVAIFGPDMGDYYTFFVENYPGKILFIGDPAVNMTEGHGSSPRNVIVIFTNETGEKTDKMSGVRVPWKGLKWG